MTERHFPKTPFSGQQSSPCGVIELWTSIQAGWWVVFNCSVLLCAVVFLIREYGGSAGEKLAPRGLACCARAPCIFFESERLSLASDQGMHFKSYKLRKPPKQQEPSARTSFPVKSARSLVTHVQPPPPPAPPDENSHYYPCSARTWRPWRTCGYPTARGSSGTACRRTSGVRRRGTLRTFAAASAGPPWTPR